MKEIVLFGKKVEIPDELWTEYMEKGCFMNDGDGIANLQEFLCPEDDTPEHVLSVLRKIISMYKPMTDAEMDAAYERKRERGLLYPVRDEKIIRSIREKTGMTQEEYENWLWQSGQEPHEDDSRHSPMEKLTLEELLYLRENGYRIP